MPAITSIINLHREGRLCQSTLQSVLRAAERAEAEGLSCEILVVVDRGDTSTLEAIAGFSDRVRVEHCDFGDLAEARNFGTSLARGQYIAFMDGDDLMGSSWLLIAAQTASRHENRDVVIHPRFNYVFGESVTPQLVIQPDMEEDRIDIEYLRAANLWTALSFAKAEIYRKFKYKRNEIDKGFGYEDWSWNFETVSAGVTHLAPHGSVHFIRKKATGSLLALSSERRIIPNLLTGGSALAQ
jgi:glycosyltransferase involved in cell wall biosynthesis